MAKSSILIANYPKINQTATFETVEDTQKIDVVTGYDVSVNTIEVTLEIARDMITALLTYDEVYLLGNNVIDVLQVWGMDYLKELLRLRLIKTVPDVGLNPVLIRGKDGLLQHDFFGYANGSENLDTGESLRFEGPFGHVENWLFKKGVAAHDRNVLISLLEDNQAELDVESLRTKAMAETSRDLRNIDFLTDQEFFRIKDGRAEVNILGELRLHNLNTLSVIAAMLRLDGMKTDGAISQLMHKKTVSVLSHPIPDGVEALTRINQQKGFPDLGQLFVNRVIGLDDVLKLRNSMDGRLFRYWALRDEYEEAQMRQDVMNSVHTVLGSRLAVAVRMLICSVMGLAGFVPGLIASATDSFVINAIAGGWHPNMFLDNKLKALLDTRINDRKNEQHLKEAETRFKGVQRNDPCPCGSGKKFKYCHGRN